MNTLVFGTKDVHSLEDLSEIQWFVFPVDLTANSDSGQSFHKDSIEEPPKGPKPCFRAE